MKPIYLLCLHGVRTGGPEAIHQLSDALIEQGFDARMVYYTWNQIAALEAAKPQSAYFFGERPVPYAEYERYRVNIADSAPNSPDCIVVLPETLCHLAPKFDKATVLIWWLSVDNAFGALSKVNLNELRRENVHHAWQSHYARDFIRALMLAEAAPPLSDYTVDLRQYADPMPWEDRPLLVLFNTNYKVVADWRGIVAKVADLDPEIECVPVGGTREGIAAMFARARLYVDLGSMPGKDRMPREAVLQGCQSLVSFYGGGTDLMDIGGSRGPFETDKIAGDIVRAVRKPLSHTFERDLQPKVYMERPTFFREVRDVFGSLCLCD